jgi:hypothetical protein
VTDLDLFDKVISETGTDRPPFRQAPPGDYLVTVRSVKIVTANTTGNKGIELTYTMVDPMHGEDMTDVDLSRCRLTDTLWVTEKSLPITQDKLVRISPEIRKMTIRDALDVLPGNDVVLTLSHETVDQKGEELRIPRLKVDRYYSVEWYNNNKKAA